ncbi:MAG: ABC transporter ATP-binding protein [Lachnospiraceae bacterium]|nr:ABC transporter ATP-binding protein [Lachnospiraceae bacterium]
MSVIKVEGLKKYYGKDPNIVRALDGINLEVTAGKFVAIVGMSGSGKSTLLHMLGGLDRPTEGKVTVDGYELTAMKDEEITLFRRRNVGFIFQSYNLVPFLSVYENIVLPIELDGKTPDARYIDVILKFLKIDQKRDFAPHQLSGGQQQRVAIARALAIKPSILLADEPTGNLDSKMSREVLAMIKAISLKLHQTIIMITHDEYIGRMAETVIRIEDGRIKGGCGCR